MIRRVKLTLTFALVAAVTACKTFAPGTALPSAGEVTRIDAGAQPFVVGLRATDGRPTFQYCRATRVDGPVSAVVGDTIIFRELTRVDPYTASDPVCRSTGAARLIMSQASGARIMSERYDRGRTTGTILLGALVAFVLVSGD